MDSGPEVTAHFDLLLTEVTGPNESYFLVQGAVGRGAELASSLAAPVASEEELAAGRAVVAIARATVEKRMDTRGVKQLLYQCAESSHWDEVAKRCLACANCTMVCPTCFCSTVVDSTDLSGTTAERTRMWDSCFNTEYSNMHGGAVRESTSARYRQWITHKLAGWQDQFGTSGCVGCGRCITWCPVGIDITEEVKGLRVLTEVSV
jgi:ferredoxin